MFDWLQGRVLAIVDRLLDFCWTAQALVSVNSKIKILRRIGKYYFWMSPLFVSKIFFYMDYHWLVNLLKIKFLIFFLSNQTKAMPPNTGLKCWLLASTAHLFIRFYLGGLLGVTGRHVFYGTFPSLSIYMSISLINLVLVDWKLPAHRAVCRDLK